MMGSLNHLLLLVLLALSLHGYSTASSCMSNEDVLDLNHISIVNILDQCGEWETIVTNNLDPSITPNNSEIDVKRQLVEKDGKKVMVVTVTLKGKSNEFSWGPLRFHTKGAKNVVVYNDGKTAMRINELTEEGYGGVLTNRPLRDNELFQVKIDKLITKYEKSLGIGITRHDLNTQDYPNWMLCGTKMLFKNRLHDGDIYLENIYGPNLRTLKVGDKVGLMKKSNGDLHYYVNGKDLGAAFTGINYRVYGVLELYGNAVEASIA